MLNKVSYYNGFTKNVKNNCLFNYSILYYTYIKIIITVEYPGWADNVIVVLSNLSIKS